MAKEITDLATELLEKIFKNLDSTSVEIANLVCKRWNDLISTRFVTKIELDDRSGVSELQRLMSLKTFLKCAEIRLKNVSANHRLINWIDPWIRLQGSSLFYFNSTAAHVSPHIVARILKKAPKLEKLTLFIDDEIDNADNLVSPVTLRKLKKLIVGGDGFQLLDAPALEHLEVQGEVTKYRVRSFERFIRASARLTSLKMNLSVLNRIDSAFSFKLKKIVCPNEPISFGEKVKEFLMSQALTVETLEARCDNTEFLEIVLTKFKRLRILKTNFRSLASSSITKEFCEQMQTLSLLTEIESSEFFSSDIAMRSVLKNCPGLLKFKCLEDSGPSDYLRFMAKYSKKLQILSISSVTASSPSFQCLKALKLRRARNSSCLIAFLRTNPSVETLDIMWLHKVDIINEDLIYGTNLKHVCLEGDDDVIDGVYERIKHGFGTWKTLQLTNEKQKFNFQFPVDSADWKLFTSQNPSLKHFLVPKVGRYLTRKRKLSVQKDPMTELAFKIHPAI